MTILVRSTPEDLHADAVLWGLRGLEAPALFWHARGHPVRQSLSAYVDAGDRQFVDDADGTIALADVDTFWNRRSAPPEVAGNLDRRDVAYAEDQSRCHMRSVLDVACPDAVWVNSPAAAASELDKLGQLRLARQVGLLFACFDLIVDRDGEWHFLDVNQMGQFLWKEEGVPGLPLLDAMCAFLASADPNFVYAEPYGGLAFADYIATGRHEHLARSGEPRTPVRSLVGEDNLRAASAEAT